MATRVMPSDLEAEMSVLGVAFLSNDALEKINDEVTEDMFYNEKNKILFNAIISLYKRGTPVDLTTIKSELDFVLASSLFVFLVYYKLPSWSIVLIGIIIGIMFY